MEQPWLNNKKWARNQISSGAKWQFIGAWIFALIWSLGLIPLYFDRADILAKAEAEPLVYLLGLFPIAAVFLLVLAIKQTRDWLNIGPMPLRLDPFPGSIGGHLGGIIDSRLDYDINARAEVSVQCIYSYISGSGKSRSRKQSVQWENTGACEIGRSAKGAEFRFRFTLPSDLNASDVPRGSSYYFWRVELEASNGRSKLHRAYDVPVFKTAELSQIIHEGTEDHRDTLRVAELGISTVADFRPTPTGLEVRYPPFQRPAAHLLAAFFGIVFIGGGWFAGSAGAPLIFPLVFSLLGGLVTLSGVYSLGKELVVTLTDEGIATQRRLFGIVIRTRRISRSIFSGFQIKKQGASQVGKKTRVQYKLLANSSENKSIIVAERLTRRPEVELIQKKYETALKL